MCLAPFVAENVQSRFHGIGSGVVAVDYDCLSLFIFLVLTETVQTEAGKLFRNACHIAACRFRCRRGNESVCDMVAAYAGEGHSFAPDAVFHNGK